MVKTGNNGHNMLPTSFHLDGNVVKPNSTFDNASDITTSVVESPETPTESWQTCMTKTEQAIQHNRQVKEYARGPLFSKLKLFSDPMELHYMTKAGVCQSICKTGMPRST